MPRRATVPAEVWADGVHPVPVRTGSIPAIARAGERQGLLFSPAEWTRIRAYFKAEGREPTDVEMAALAQSWSEHCSYKSSKVWLKRAFRGLNPPRRVLGTGDAGVLAFDEGYAYAIRAESHNHPSAVEPYGGAATGIGGILRDVLAVGAKPIALADPLFFGPIDGTGGKPPKGVHPARWLMSGVIAGIRDYGNRVGVPTVTGSVSFDPSYSVNPLVNVACLGFLPRERLQPNRANRVGDRLVLVGGLTGRDGIGGVAFASRELTSRSEDESRGAVQLGNPIMKEPLIHACLEAFDRDLVRGVKDLGGGGLAAASGELAYAGGFGMTVDLDLVPVRESGLQPWEVWISESQERMILDVRPDDLDTLLAVFRRYDVPATAVGTVTAGPFEEIRWHGQLAARLRLAFRVDPPLLTRPQRRRPSPKRRPPKVPDDAIGALAEELLLAPDSVSRESIIRVYDHAVQGRTVIFPLQGHMDSPSHGDASILRPRPESWRAIAVTVASQPWACREDPSRGAEWTVEEAARNLYAVGAKPDALTDCLNFGSPEDPLVMGDFVATVDGLARAAKALGLAVPSGNVSFYNHGLGIEVPPTPVLFATGIVPDLRHAVTSDLKQVGDPLYLIGKSSAALGGSLYARRRGLKGLPIPPVDPGYVRRAGDRLLGAMARGWVRAAHDVSDGGLAVTIPEMAFGGAMGFQASLDATGLAGPGSALVAEGGSRWVVEVGADAAKAFEHAMRGLGVTRLGEVTESGGEFLWGPKLLDSLDLGRLYERWRAGLDAVGRR
ncbi:MAG: phosphoribosylformylglycinamidine synthase subunit PurL [Thermoplasmata archaeon]|nr:phosphoribosylformylglycinamidine synthase subunit PurL [Thermoplasmata archaeon]